MKNYYTMNDVCEITNKGYHTIYAYIVKKKLNPEQFLSGRVFFSKDELERFLYNYFPNCKLK
jgi:predicted site-specific integrase-resolvase